MIDDKYHGEVHTLPVDRLGLKNETENLYLPRPARIIEIEPENDLVLTFVLVFEDALYNERFSYQPGQFAMVSVPHQGEAPISFSSSPTRKGSFSLTIRKAGKLTSAIHSLQAGDIIGIRGPYGRPFPMDELRGRNIIFVAGGIGMAPLRSAIVYCLDNRQDFGKITVLYGCKNMAEICFCENFDKWRIQTETECLLIVDKGCEVWKGPVGLVTELLEEIKPDISSDKALVCGPGVMIRCVLEQLQQMGFPEKNLITTLERHMKCGVGLCGHCYIEGNLVCKDGPVFGRDELTDLESL